MLAQEFSIEIPDAEADAIQTVSQGALLQSMQIGVSLM
jgi:acyl carrier protein